MVDDNAFECEYEGFSPGYHVLQEEVGSCISAMSSSVVSAAPSALRRGKYTSHYYDQSDADTDLGNSTIESNTLQNNHGYFYPRNNMNKNFRLPDGNNSSASKGRKINRKKISPRPVPSLPSNITLSNGVDIGESGYILGRCTKMALLFKKQWQQMVWVHCKPCTILLFCSLKDSQKWMDSKYLSKDEKKKLVKFSINVDLTGKYITSGGSKNREGLSCAKSGKYCISDVKTKRSTVDGSYTHRFQVERWRNSGTSVEAGFCSSDVLEVKMMRKALRKCLKKALLSTTKKNGQSVVGDSSSKHGGKSVRSVDKSTMSSYTEATSRSHSIHHTKRKSKSKRIN